MGFAKIRLAASFGIYVITYRNRYTQVKFKNELRIDVQAYYNRHTYVIHNFDGVPCSKWYCYIDFTTNTKLWITVFPIHNHVMSGH